MKTFQQFIEQYSQNPGKYSDGFSFPIKKGVPRNVMSQDNTTKDKQAQINYPEFQKFLKQNVGKQIWQRFSPSNEVEYLNRETMKFQNTKPSKGTRAMNPNIKFLPPGQVYKSQLNN